ncbi:uroporphyrinogen-III synthase [Neokomagataea anthophila]|uniref:uroporphyrinogen-III synthase n=1 Tax=Neokomagataea anthophila TaxID=2826925 RepID=UPI0031FD952C
MIRRYRSAVVVTRPEPGLSETVQAVEKRNWRAVASPMLNIQGMGVLPVEKARALLVTSGQALPALSEWPRTQAILAVGEKTALRARAMGFEDVAEAGGDADSLEHYCRGNGLMGTDIVLVTGRGYGVALAQSLGAVRREVYDVQLVDAITPGTVQVLQADCAEAVLFYSGRTVEAFCRAMPDALYARLKGVRALCFSQAIAERVPAEDWKTVEYGDPLALLGKRVVSGG